LERREIRDFQLKKCPIAMQAGGVGGAGEEESDHRLHSKNWII
jgi:hypothetical protein